MGGISNMNKIRGPSKYSAKRVAKTNSKRAAKVVPAVTTQRVITKKKQKQMEKALKNQKKLLAAKGIIEYEEDMKDVALPDPGRQRVITACIPPDDVLAAAAAGPGTVLGAPQQL